VGPTIVSKRGLTLFGTDSADIEVTKFVVRPRAVEDDHGVA